MLDHDAPDADAAEPPPDRGPADHPRTGRLEGAGDHFWTGDRPGTTATLTRTSTRVPAVTADSRILHKVLDEMAIRLPAEELLDSLAAFISAALGEGAVIWPAVGEPRVDGRPVVAHPDADVRRRVRRALAGGCRRPDPATHHTVRHTEATEARLLADLRGVTGQAIVTPVRRSGQILGHIAAFAAGTTPDTHRYGRGDRRLLERLSAAAAVALDHIAHGDPTLPDTARRRRPPPGHRPHPDGRLALLPRQPGPNDRDAAHRPGSDGADQSRALADAFADEPIQRIVSGLLTLEHLRGRLDDNARRVVDEVTGQLEDSLAWLRNLIVIALTPPDLADGLGRALGGLARSIFAGTGTRVTVTGPNHVPLDPAAMETVYRIFREALTNVRRHAGAGSVTLRIHAFDDRVVLRLSDDGIGTAQLTADVDSRGVRAMRARAENAGATLTIDSGPDRGTTVTVAVAARRRIPAVPTITSGPPLVAQRTRRIVVCDDQHDLREAIKLVLADVPRFRVVAEAADGPSGLDEIRLHRPDLILLDVNMPGGGPDLARAAKDASPTSHIVVFSGRDDAATRDAMLAAGADQYVVKSGRLRLLLEALDNAG